MHQVLVAAGELLVAACMWDLFPDQGSNPDPLYWERGVLTTSTTGWKSLDPILACGIASTLAVPLRYFVKTTMAHLVTTGGGVRETASSLLCLDELAGEPGPRARKFAVPNNATMSFAPESEQFSPMYLPCFL